ncbi:protein kinase domain-containing protein [Aporhodopirellula aestuarii]|uniref:Protein kinase n=1 Tax=Aporhodopirellula aestuarii TaxID=2950107 RepID=A0ABT0TZN1_9BACT|nr:serine/threonine-protein kinase [Aporhodopirellula aestuarii]MCM2370025.1 protein kinase [Aporhodopirellula aestuarii]
MKLSDLPARELARLDAICLEYESRVREVLRTGGDPQSVQTEIAPLVERYGGEHAPLLRTELEAILEELMREHREGGPSSGQLDVAKIAAGAGSTTSDTEHGHPTPGDVHGAPTEAIGIAAADKHGADETPDDLPNLGDTIGPYLLTSVLGRGGMGIVYRATDTRLDRSVAIKMLSLHDRQSHVLVERFQREAKAVAALTHPHIVELFDIGVYEGMPYVVMEHLRGETLMHRMQKDRIASEPITTQQIRNWGIQLADALAVAHASGVIHRDIKPENVMVMNRARPSTSDGEGGSNSGDSKSGFGSSLKLFDFGLSRVGSTNWQQDSGLSPILTPENARKISDNDSATRVGMILGTPGYMAPEQARGGVITPAADVFSLGCVLFEAMFGRPAFSGETATKRFTAVLEKQPLADPARRRDDVALADLILSMLSKDPSARPSAAEVLNTLQSSGPGLRNPSRDGSTLIGANEARHDGSVVISRRRLVELLGGAVAGGVLGATLLPGKAKGELRAIRSIGVLRFQNASAATISNDDAVPPDRMLDQGELLSGLLVNELSRIDGITVPKYVPITATQPEEFREAARLLEVDALVTGTFSLTQAGPDPIGLDATGTKRIMTVNVDIISGRTGYLIEGLVIPTAAGDNLIEQAELAQELAAAIGRELSQNDENGKLSNPEAFTCLVKGRTLSDPDTAEAMKTALRCFQHALSVDSNYAQAHAGVALTAISLAAREDDEQANDLVSLSQEASSRALALSPGNRDALLARAMLNYQVLADFDTADDTLRSLVRTSPNHWQVHHQAGWLKIIQLEDSQGMQFMRRATGLHPASRFLKTELARAEWFRGNADRAIQSAIGLIRDNVAMEEDRFARGLLIDIHEQSSNFIEAAKLDSDLEWSPTIGGMGYFAAREKRLSELPYGPFGPTINAAILQLRRNDLAEREPPDLLLARLIAAQLPMLPLVLCKHPAMTSMTLLEQAAETYSVLRFG